VKNLIKKIVPQAIRIKRLEYLKHRKKIKIVKYLKRSSEFDDEEKKEIVNYFAKNPLAVFPYEFTKKYNPKDVVVHTDNENNMKCVWHEKKRLYFKKNWSEEKIQNYYNGILLEQDVESSHRYETADFYVKENDVVVDVGVAEGNFALSVVEKAKKIYLFEIDEEWIDVLKITFAPWKEKVEIVCKYVSDKDSDSSITLDTFFSDKQKVDFIKADIEGAEIAMLKGGQSTLSNTENQRIVLCAYHKQNDAKEIDTKLKEAGFHTAFSKNHMIFYLDKTLDAPFLRKGVVYAVKK